MPRVSDSLEAQDPVLLFDGECGVCNRVVRLLLSIDRRGKLRFAPLQGLAGQELLRLRGLPLADFETAILLRSWKDRATEPLLVRTDAALAALASCGGPWRVLAGIFSAVPRSLRDMAYRWVARIRYRLAGPWKDRPLKKEVWRQRFLS